jgi:hypothetical protein
MLDRARPLSLWGSLWDAVQSLRPAFSNTTTFMWFATVVAGMIVRVDLLGVTSIVRALNLRPELYHALLRLFHSTAVKLDRLTALWAHTVLLLFPSPVRVNSRLVLVGDGVKIPKRGKKMPAVSLLVHAAHSVFAVPLAARIHEGLVWSNRDKRTLLDKMLSLLQTVSIETSFYFVADAYYAAGKVVKGLLKQGHHLLSRVKSNAVAYQPAEPPRAKRKRGAPRRYGKKIKVKSLLEDPQTMREAPSPVYGEDKVVLRYRVCDLLWRPAGELVRFVAVIHPTRGPLLLMCTDISLGAIDIIRLYGLRFKIEHSFKQAIRLIGSFAYHFWMKGMVPLRRRNGNQYLHRQSSSYREQVKRKVGAYHVFIQAGVVAQGLLQYLAVVAPKLVWASFGSWLRTIRPGIPPSELVVAQALRQTLPDFLLVSCKVCALAKFIADRQDTQNMRIFRMSA